MGQALPSTPYWQLKLDAPGETVVGVEDVDQCIRLILATPLGTDPLRPTFGCTASDHLDAPGTVSPARSVRAVSEALRTWEPRIVVDQVQASSPGAGQLEVLVTWHLVGADAASTFQTRSALGAGAA